MVEVAASALLRAGYGKDNSVALFLGNSPDHPVNFFGALKAGARVVHLSPLDGEIALSHKLSRQRRAHSGHQQSRGAAADGAEISRQGPARSPDRLRGRPLGRGRQSAYADPGSSGDRHLQQRSSRARPRRRNGRRSSADDVALLQYTGGTTGLPKGAMLSHGNLTSAVSIYDVWGKTGARRARRHRARDLRAAAVSYLRADGDPAAQPRARRSDLAAPALRCRGRDARHRGQARHRVSRRADDVDRDREPARSGKPRSVVAGVLRIGRRAAAGRGREDLRAQDQHEAQERLGHDRDLLARHRPSPGGTGQAGLDRADAARHRNGRGRRSTIPSKVAAGGRGRRNPHPRAERHQGLLEPAEGNRARLLSATAS